jgi:hypothetical protein
VPVSGNTFPFIFHSLPDCHIFLDALNSEYSLVFKVFFVSCLLNKLLFQTTISRVIRFQAKKSKFKNIPVVQDERRGGHLFYISFLPSNLSPA